MMKLSIVKKMALTAGLLGLVACGGPATETTEVASAPQFDITTLQRAGGEFLRIPAEEVNWVSYPGLAGELGMRQAVLHGDPSQPGLYVIRVRFPPGVMSTPHSHPEDRFAVVLQGTWWTGIGSDFDPANTEPIRPGDAMLHPAGEFHFDGARGEETILQMVGIGPSGKTLAHPDEPDFARHDVR